MIVSSVSGTIVALDRDVPPVRQRRVFPADGGRAPLRWLLEGGLVAPAPDRVLWAPARDRYTLSIADGQQVLDTVGCEVR